MYASMEGRPQTNLFDIQFLWIYGESKQSHLQGILIYVYSILS